MYPHKNKKWLSYTLIFALIFTLVFPSMGLGAEGKQLQSRIDLNELPWSSEDIAGLRHDGKINALSQSERTTRFHAERLAGEEPLATQTIAPQNYVPASDSKELISVIVELQTEPTAVYQAMVQEGTMKADAQHQTKLKTEQEQFAVAAKKLNAKMNRQYSEVFNGYSMQISANLVDSLLALPGVKAVYEDIEYFAEPIENITPHMDISAPHIGSHYFWDLGFDGTGIKVGVLDTGIDYNHPSLAEAYKGGYDFIDNDDDPMETPPNPNNPDAVTSHGTHVAGTVGGRGNPDDPNSETGWVRGVAPGSDIYAYRVLGPGGRGATSGIIAAIERSLADGLDVINLSLGSDSNNQFDALSVALNNVTLAGVIAVTSNGNAGPDPYTVGVPGTAELAISVGASYPPLFTPTVSGANLDKIYAALMSYSPDIDEVADQPLEIVFAGLGRAQDFNGLDVAGKVALISRGEISFTEKSLNAKAAGAVAALVHNNAPGGFGGTLGEPGDYIPTLSISQEEGLALRANIAETTGYTVTLASELEKDLMGDFSSRGPSLPGYAIKPDISAPGVNITSSVPSWDGNYEDAYASNQGTSMASPHIAGAAALLLQKDSSLNPYEVKASLMNNTFKMSDRSGERYSHMDQGAGRVDLEKTLEAVAVALVEETTTAVTGGTQTAYQTGSISFGQKNAGETDRRTITVKDIANESSTYTVSSVWYGASAGNITTSTNEVTVNAGGSSDFDVSLTIDSNTADGRYEGEVILTEAAGHTLQIPFAVYVGTISTPDPVTNINLDPLFFSPNGDGVADTTDITFRINSPLDYFSLDVYNVDDEGFLNWEGTIIETYAGIGIGSYIVRGWDGTVVDIFDELLLDDNFYVVVPWYGDAYDYYPIIDQASPFVLDTLAPESALDDPALTVEGNTGTITGQILSDLMIDIFGDYSGIGVAALYEDSGWKQVDGTIDNHGAFSIQVPLQEGDNLFEIYIYDLANNGTIEPAYLVEYTHGTEQPEPEKGISAVASKDRVQIGEAFEIAVNFTDLEDVYATQFSLTFDADLAVGTVTPSVTLHTYLQEQNPGASLIINENRVALEEGLTRLDYIVSLVGDISGYTGSGSLATINFGSDAEGTFHFDLSNVRLLDSEANDIDFGPISHAVVTVTDSTTPVDPDHTITGNINAEGFVAGVDYSETWYTGADGTHKVTVEALNASGTVEALGTVHANGSYTLTVSGEGTYTVRVVIPGHISTSASVTVTEDGATQNFALVAGDVNQDGKVDLVDLQLVAREFGKAKGSAWPNARASAADINRDNVIDILDVSFILNNMTLGR